MRESNWEKSDIEETDAKKASDWSRLAFLASWLCKLPGPTLRRKFRKCWKRVVFRRSLCVDEIEEEKAFGVIKAAIEVGHVLGMTVIAEGVETREQFNSLIKANCDLAQGFLLFKPMPVPEVANLLIDEMYRVTGKSPEQAA